MFKGVIFDIDGTLYDYQTSDMRAMKHFCKFVEASVTLDPTVATQRYRNSSVIAAFTRFNDLRRQFQT